MRIAILSDIHAGLGMHDSELRKLQSAAVASAASYLKDEEIDTLILNGDTTDHLLNALSCQTSKEIAIEVLYPLVALIREQRGSMQTLVMSGNTDWPVADPSPQKQQVFFEYTGLDAAHASLSPALLHTVEAGDVMLAVTHGHAFNPAQWGHVGSMSKEDYTELWETLKNPNQQFLDAISATSGSHRSDYLKAVMIGSVVKLMPHDIREKAVEMLGNKFTTEYEQQYTHALTVLTQQTQKKVLGVMGHTHIAGIRSYEGMTILNTGTTGAKPNPLQRLKDPVAHMAVVDTEQGAYALIQTHVARRPLAKPQCIAKGSFCDLAR